MLYDTMNCGINNDDDKKFASLAKLYELELRRLQSINGDKDE